jgi:hypothetical protein
MKHIGINNVADPGCLSLILDPTCFHPGSRGQTSTGSRSATLGIKPIDVLYFPSPLRLLELKGKIKILVKFDKIYLKMHLFFPLGLIQRLHVPHG